MSSWLADKFAGVFADSGKMAIRGYEGAHERRYAQLAHGVAKQNAATAEQNMMTAQSVAERQAAELDFRRNNKNKELSQTDRGLDNETARIAQAKTAAEMAAAQAKRAARNAAIERLSKNLPEHMHPALEAAIDAEDSTTITRLLQEGDTAFRKRAAQLEGAKSGARATATQNAQTKAEIDRSVKREEGWQYQNAGRVPGQIQPPLLAPTPIAPPGVILPTRPIAATTPEVRNEKSAIRVAEKLIEDLSPPAGGTPPLEVFELYTALNSNDETTIRETVSRILAERAAAKSRGGTRAQRDAAAAERAGR